MDHVRVLSQISVVAALFYLDNSRKIRLRGVRACQLKDAKRRVPQHEAGRERERESTHARGREGVHACGGEEERERKRARTWERERKHTCTRGREKARMHAWERERELMHVGERETESALAPPLCFFLPSGPAPCKLGLARSAVCPT